MIRLKIPPIEMIGAQAAPLPFVSVPDRGMYTERHRADLSDDSMVR